MSRLSASFLAAATGGHWLIPPISEVELRAVKIDSRDDLARCAFLAIRGPRHDGHDFLGQAANRGACMLVVDRDVHPLPCTAVPVLRVASTRQALLDMARAFRRTLAARVIAVTGSAGKTTTKHLIHEILASRWRGSAALKSFNNDIGVPLTILNSMPGDEYVVIEIGTNAPGEIDRLAEVATPDIAVITSIGHSHLERLGSVEGVAREKASIMRHVRSGGLALIHDTPLLGPLVPRGLNAVRFGRTDAAEFRLTGRGADQGQGWFVVNGGARFELALPGEHNALNAVAAVAVARYMGLSDNEIWSALKGVRPPAMRMTSTRIGGIELYNDAYNANPESMTAALRTFGELTANASRRVLLLGDMLELGTHAHRLHREIMQRVEELHAAAPLSLVALFGRNFRGAWQVMPARPCSFDVHVHDDLDERRAEQIAGLLRPGDIALVKGSRGMAMERVINALQSQHEAGGTHLAGRNRPSQVRASVAGT